MYRTLLLLLLLVSGGSRAGAFDAEGATAELTSLDALGGFSVGVFGVDTSLSSRPAEENQPQSKTAALDVSWYGNGLLIALSAGKTTYTELTRSGLMAGSIDYMGITLRQEIATLAGGSLRVGFSEYEYAAGRDRWRELDFSLRWSRRF